MRKKPFPFRRLFLLCALATSLLNPVTHGVAHAQEAPIWGRPLAPPLASIKYWYAGGSETPWNQPPVEYVSVSLLDGKGYKVQRFRVKAPGVLAAKDLGKQLELDASGVWLTLKTRRRLASYPSTVPLRVEFQPADFEKYDGVTSALPALTHLFSTVTPNGKYLIPESRLKEFQGYFQQIKAIDNEMVQVQGSYRRNEDADINRPQNKTPYNSVLYSLRARKHRTLARSFNEVLKLSGVSLDMCTMKPHQIVVTTGPFNFQSVQTIQGRVFGQILLSPYEIWCADRVRDKLTGGGLSRAQAMAMQGEVRFLNRMLLERLLTSSAGNIERVWRNGSILKKSEVEGVPLFLGTPMQLVSSLESRLWGLPAVPFPDPPK